MPLHLLIILFLFSGFKICTCQSCFPKANPYTTASQAHLLPRQSLPGHTRSVIHPHHFALLTPESRVYSSPPPGFSGLCSAAAVVTPALGAHFSMYLLNASTDAQLKKPVMFQNAPEFLERLIYVLTGAVTVVNRTSDEDIVLTSGGYVYFAPGEDSLALKVDSEETGCIVIDRVYGGIGGAKSLIGNEGDLEEKLTGGEMFRMKQLLPATDQTLDFNVHVMDFSPGEYLNVKEVHYNQHGLLMLTGEGIYMLGERFFPVSSGDVIYMGPFVPQWYAALGKSPTRYWLYKDTGSNPLCDYPNSVCTA